MHGKATVSTGRASPLRRSQTACSRKCSRAALCCSTTPPSTRPRLSPASSNPCRRTAIRSSRSRSCSSPETIPSTAPAARSRPNKKQGKHVWALRAAEMPGSEKDTVSGSEAVSFSAFEHWMKEGTSRLHQYCVKESFVLY